MKHPISFIKNTTILILLTGFSILSAGERTNPDILPERKTYLPEYRMSQLFPTDFTGSVPFYSMDPFPESQFNYFDRKTILPADYRHSRGEYLMGSFSEILYFTVRFTEEGQLEIEDEDRNNLQFLTRIKEIYNTDITLCLAGSSQNILPAVKEESKRKETIADIEDLLQNYGLSGVDLDWEYPRNDLEKDLHRQFLLGLKEMTSRTGTKLSMAVSRDRLLPDETYKIPDRINLMTYDYFGKHSTWESTLEAVEYMMVRYAIPPEKLLMGLPFYGRIFDGFSPDYWKKSQSYMEIVRDYSPLPVEDEAGGYFFNGPIMIRRKMEMAAEHKLQGVFIWEIGQDIPDKSSLSRIVLDFDS